MVLLVGDWFECEGCEWFVGGVLWLMGGCDVLILLSGCWLCEYLVNVDGIGMCALVVLMCLCGWFDLVCIDFVFVGVVVMVIELEYWGL